MDKVVKKADDNTACMESRLEPLDLDILLKHVMYHLSTKGVANCRLVCKRWESLSTKIMLKRRDHIITLTCATAPEFILIMESSRCIPYPCVKWNCWSLDNIIFSNLIDTCRGVLKVLVIDMDCNSGFVSINDNALHCTNGKRRDSDRTGLYFMNLLGNLPLLEVVDFDEISPKFANPKNIDITKESELISSTLEASSLRKIVISSQEESFCGGLWSSIFRIAPNLQEIHTNHGNQTIPIFEALKNSGRLGQLRKLRLEDIDKSQIDTILESNMILEEFRLNVISNNVIRKQLEILLRKFSPTLQVLALGSPANNSKIRIKLPKMLKLIELGLYHCDDSLIVLEDLKFHEDVPKLKKLSVSSAYTKLDWKEYFSYNEKNPTPTPVLSVQNLTLAVLIHDQKCCSYLGQLFPNIKKLEIEFPRPIFLKKIWTTWKDLTDLYIYYNINSKCVMDVGLCGFSATWKSNMDKRIASLPSESARIQFLEDTEIPVLNTGITNLKGLQRLTVEFNPLDVDARCLLTDLSVYFCLSQLKDLRVLKIGRSVISPSAAEYLKQQLPMISLMDIRGKEGPGVFSQQESEELEEYFRYYNYVDNRNEDAV